MSTWNNKHGSGSGSGTNSLSTGTGAPPHPHPPLPPPPPSNIPPGIGNNNRSQRRSVSTTPRSTSSGEDGEIGEEEGEIIVGVGGSKNMNSNSNISAAKNPSSAGESNVSSITNYNSNNTRNNISSGAVTPNPLSARSISSVGVSANSDNESSIGGGMSDRPSHFVRGSSIGGGVPSFSRRSGTNPTWGSSNAIHSSGHRGGGRGGGPPYGPRGINRQPPGNRTFTGPVGMQHQSSMSMSQQTSHQQQQIKQQQQPPPPPLPSVPKPDFVQRSQTFSGFAISSLNSNVASYTNRAANNNPPSSSQQQQYHTPQQQQQGALSGSSNVSQSGRGFNLTNTAPPGAGSRPTDPRFRGSESVSGDPRFRGNDTSTSDSRLAGSDSSVSDSRFRGNDASSSRFSTSSDAGNTTSNNVNLTPLTTGRGIHHNASHQQLVQNHLKQNQMHPTSSVSHHFSATKDNSVSSDSSSNRDSTILRREPISVSRISYSSVVESNEPLDSTRSNLLSHRHDGSSRFSRSNDVEFSQGVRGSTVAEVGVSYTSPHRSSMSRIPKSDLFSRVGSSSLSVGDDDDDTTMLARPVRENSTSFRSSLGGSKDVTSDSAYSSRPRTPSNNRESYRSESSSHYDGGSLPNYSSRATSRDTSSFRAGPPPLSDGRSKDYDGHDNNITNNTLPSSSNFGLRGPLTSQRDTYRGGLNRRSSDFGIGNSNARGYGTDETSYRSSAVVGESNNDGPSSLRSSSSSDVGDANYINNVSGNGNGNSSASEFRRSPAPRRQAFGMGRENSVGVGGLPVPPLGRTNSFSQRRTDPRFIPANYEQDASVSGFAKNSNEGTQTLAVTVPAANNDDVSKQQSFVKLADGDPFGRTREWSISSSSSALNISQPRRSPQASPMNRRTSLTYSHSSPSERPKLTAPSLITVAANVPLVNDFSSMSFVNASTDPSPPALVASIPAASKVTTGSLPPSSIEPDISREQQPLQPLPPPAVQEDVSPSPLLTSALGESNIKRGEQVISEVANLLHCIDLKSTIIGGLCKLPSKKQILQAVALMDTKLKESQQILEGTKAEMVAAINEEESIRHKAKEEAVSEAKRQEDERRRREEEYRTTEENSLEAELDEITKQRMDELEKEKKQNFTDLEKELSVAKDAEEQKLKDNLNKQMLSAADDFDKDIEKIKKDIDKTKQNVSKTEAKLSTAETDYNAMIEDIKKNGVPETEARSDDLIASILADNQRRSAEAHILYFADNGGTMGDDQSIDEVEEDLENIKDPQENRSSAEWALLAQQVTGPENALYTDPSTSPYYLHNEQRHLSMETYIAEYIKEKERLLTENWTSLAEEYEYRRYLYDKTAPIRDKKTMKSSSIIERYSTLGPKTVQTVLESNGSRTNSNPYRRARRGNEVRSESEFEQVIAELAEKEAMQKRITCGGISPAEIRQKTTLENRLSVTFVNTFVAQKVDMLRQEEELASTNIWSDMEKCIFLDRFMQHPKDFRKIASFLRNKSTSDCVRYYYDSKQSVPYKQALREHIMRRKRRGDYHVWDATVEAALSSGSTIQAGVNEEKPLVFKLPENDHTYYTQTFHPIRRNVFDSIDVSDNALAIYDESVSDDDEPKRHFRSRKRPREPLFVLDAVHKKFLKNQESPPPVQMKKVVRAEVADPEQTELTINTSASSVNNSVANEADFKDDPSMTPLRKAPQKWTADEKKTFIDTLAKHGRNWNMLSLAVGTKSTSQIKNYYYDYKKQSGKGRIEKKASKIDESTNIKDTKSRDEDTITPPPTASRASSPSETPMEESISHAGSYESKAQSFSGDATVVASNIKPSLPESKVAVNVKTAERSTVARVDTRTKEPGPVEKRLMENRLIEQRAHEQRPTEHKTVGARGAEVLQQRAAEAKKYDNRSAEQRMMESRTVAFRPMERPSTDQRVNDQEPRSLERTLHTTGARDSSGYGWPSTSVTTQSDASERNTSALGTSNGDSWGQSLNISDDSAARRLLHQQQQQHQQQILSSFFPWVPPSQSSTGGNFNDLMRMQQQAQLPSHHQPPPPSHHQPPPPSHHQPPLQSQHLHQQHYHQQPNMPQHGTQILQQRQLTPQQQLQQLRHGPPHSQAQTHSRHQQAQLHQQHPTQQDHQRQLPLQNPVNNLGNASINTLLAMLAQPSRNPPDEAQLAFAQHLLGLQGDISANDALSLLTRLSNQGNFHGSGGHGNR